MNGNIAVGTMVILVLFMIPTVAADNTLYFVPQGSSGATGEEVTISLYCDATDNIGGGQVHIYFDPDVVNITSGEEIVGTDWISWNFYPYGYAGHTYAAITFAQWGGSFSGNKIGIANLTLVGATPDISSLEMPVHPTKTMLFDPRGPAVSTAVVNGTFTCTAGDLPQCLGTCYVGTCDGELVGEIGKMNCSECLKERGRVWKPNMDTACFGDTTPSDLCLDWCPECCDGVNNDDADTNTDYPADVECTCGLDLSEAAPMNPIPELSTFLLTSLGILSLVLLTRKRD